VAKRQPKPDVIEYSFKDLALLIATIDFHPKEEAIMAIILGAAIDFKATKLYIYQGPLAINVSVSINGKRQPLARLTSLDVRRRLIDRIKTCTFGMYQKRRGSHTSRGKISFADQGYDITIRVVKGYYQIEIEITHDNP